MHGMEGFVFSGGVAKDHRQVILLEQRRTLTFVSRDEKRNQTAAGGLGFVFAKGKAVRITPEV